MSNLSNIYERVYRWIEETVLGFSTAVTISLLWTEFVHILSIIIGGVVSTIAIHYVNKWLKKNDK